MPPSARPYPDPLSFIRLLRGDVRKFCQEAGDEKSALNEWWGIMGRHIYPAWADDVPAQEAGLFECLSNWPSYGQFGMTRLLDYLLRQREDLRNTFDVSTEQGLWQAIAWQFCYGLFEYQLQDTVPPALIQALDETPPFLPGEGDTAAKINWLMFFLWRTEPVLQSRFDLRSVQGQTAYLVWFFVHGVSIFKLEKLLTPRWLQMLRSHVRPIPGHDASLSIAMMFLLESRLDLIERFPIATPQGIHEFNTWAAQSVESEPFLKWLHASVRPPRPAAKPAAGTKRPFGLNLIGFAFGELGIGEDVRMAVLACQAAKIPFKVINIHPGDRLRQQDRMLSAHIDDDTDIDEAPYAFNLHCFPAFNSALVYLDRGRALFESRYNIGWWPWELPVWPKDWGIALDLVDEIWAATTFTHDMYCAARQRHQADKPVITLMPMPASVDRVVPLTREKLGLPDKPFMFLYVFDFNSFLARKNPFAAIRAFRQAFDEQDDTVCLVLKTMNSNPKNPDWQRFLRECRRDKRIVLLDKTLDRGEVLGLIQFCDAYVSLHRSEGLGRTLAEAMLFGKPVVGTNFSGNVDFLKHEVGFPVTWKKRMVRQGEYNFIQPSDRAWWAEPDIADAARQMRAARLTSRDAAFAKRVVTHAKTVFSPQRIGRLMKIRLETIAQGIVHQPGSID